jgi:hypothetical protein
MSAEWRTLPLAEKASKYKADAAATAAYAAAMQAWQKTQPPKRPSNSYALYVKQSYPALKVQGLSFVDAGKRLAIEWKTLPAAKKQAYVDEAAALSAEYQRAKDAYESEFAH